MPCSISRNAFHIREKFLCHAITFLHLICFPVYSICLYILFFDITFQLIVSPVLNAFFSNPEYKIRCHACEALYSIASMNRIGGLVYNLASLLLIIDLLIWMCVSNSKLGMA